MATLHRGLMPDDSPLLIPKHVLSESLNDETVLLDMSSGLYFGLSPVASRFWQLVGQGHPLDQVRATMLDEFDVAPEVLETDLQSLIADLEARKLVERQAN